MTVIGGDLSAMTALSQRFGQAGSTFQSQSTAIARRVAAALEEFTTEMRQLDAEARGLSEEISSEMTRLDGQAAATNWTGANRDKMDGIVATLDDDIVRLRTAIDSFVGEASAVVNGSLNTMMTELSTNVETAGVNAQQVSESFRSGVEQQRAAFDQVMNG